MIALFDTNVLLDVIQNRQPFYRDSSQAWNLAERKLVTGYVSAISFNNVFYITRKQTGDAEAVKAVKLVRALFGTVPLDEVVIDRAIAMNVADFEDAIQAASAVQVHADCVVTRNVKDFKGLHKLAVTPEELLALAKP